MSRTEVGRRRLLRATGIAGAIAIAGCSAPTHDDEHGTDGNQDGGGTGSPLGEPDYGGYLDDARNHEGLVNRRGEDEVTVAVGAGEGSTDLDSGDPVDATGVQYEHTVEESGTTTYYCDPHETVGMNGALYVP